MPGVKQKIFWMRLVYHLPILEVNAGKMVGVKSLNVKRESVLKRFMIISQKMENIYILKYDLKENILDILQLIALMINIRKEKKFLERYTVCRN